jgi:hypothetical protein
MNWTVKVKTKTGYIKDVEVKDYVYPDDAIRAALSQTGSTEYISYSPSSTQDQNYNSSRLGSDSDYASPIVFGPQYSFADQIQLSLMMVGGILIFAFVPPLAILVVVALVIKLVKVNLRNN